MAGIPDALFWNLTPFELAAVLDRVKEQEKRATLRAGLVAATIVNVNLKKGARLVQPSDFIVEPIREEDFMDADASAQMMDRWAASAYSSQDDEGGLLA